jgi:hypothetical protein
MRTRIAPKRILWYECIGFAVLITLSWLDELFGLPTILFGGRPHDPSWREAMMETVAILVVWLPVLVLTRRLLSRLFYLEGFLRVCAWCRKICHEGEWVPLERYFADGLDTQTSHGICPTCAGRMEKEIS